MRERPGKRSVRPDGFTRRFFCIHGHFYQPPRENPWLEEIELEESAAPYHDWNERICAECYAPNARARIVDDSGQVQRMINNYEWISFNVGPTLLAWMERAAGSILEAIVEADRRSRDRCGGHGNAIAQPYTHAILPLADKRDKALQVHWGIEAFRHYFHRDPEGMWLPETAVDVETLEILSRYGIRFTVLSPHQGRLPGIVRSETEDGWGGPGPDPRRPYRCRLPSGGEITLFFYDAEIARQVAFQGLLRNGEAFFRYMDSRFDPDRAEAQLVHFATDGETFGHHHRFGEMALAYMIAHLEEDETRRLTNYGEFLSLFPPTDEVEIVEKSSWSCVHGVERWRSDCGCRTRGSAYHQRWRGPLRDAMDHLKAEVDTLFEREAAKLFPRPWEVLESYVRLMLDGPGEGRRDLVGLKCPGPVTEGDTIRALKLLEMERHRQLMFTSCAWFFDDISTIETVHALKHAARAIQLAGQVACVSLEGSFLALLEHAPSNVTEVGNGRRLWERQVRPAVADQERILAHGAARRIFSRDPSPRVGRAYSVRVLEESLLGGMVPRFAVGYGEVTSEVTLERTKGIYVVVYLGGIELQLFCMPCHDEAAYASLKEAWVAAFRKGSLGDLHRSLLRGFRRRPYRFADLFRDEQHRVAEAILRERLKDYEVLFRVLFDRDESLLRSLEELRLSVPEPMREAARGCLAQRIRSLAARLATKQDLLALGEMGEQAAAWGYRPQGRDWKEFLSRLLEEKIRALTCGTRIPALLEEAGYILDAAERFGLELDLWKAQDLFAETCGRIPFVLRPYRDDILAFAKRIRLCEGVLPPSLRPGRVEPR